MPAFSVHLDAVGAAPLLVGQVEFSRVAKRNITRFSYADSYLSSGAAYALDPGLPLRIAPTASRWMPGALSDCSPDSWGRRLISRRLAQRSAQHGLQHEAATEADFLAGVSDATRQGALRISADGGDTFLDPDTFVPELIDLADLTAASRAVEEGRSIAAVQTLLAAGSSTLGGARPKASVVDEHGMLLVAKFGSIHDQRDAMAWEKTSLDLAERAGLNVPARRLVKIAGHNVLLIARFDRGTDAKTRIGYLSAATMTQAASSGGNDYLDLAAAIEDHSARPAADLADIWRRIAVTVALNNTDDHFRNHGFLRTPSGWRLSPVRRAA
jgi:serine/threonine-protein kinase HipA